MTPLDMLALQWSLWNLQVTSAQFVVSSWWVVNRELWLPGRPGEHAGPTLGQMVRETVRDTYQGESG